MSEYQYPPEYKTFTGECPPDPRFRMVEITWLDACCEEGHVPPKAASEVKPLLRRNIGYVLEETEQYIIATVGFLENFYKGEVAYDMVFAFPRGMITEVRELS